MLLRGGDFHTRFPQMARLDSETGERIERRWEQPGEARQLWRQWVKLARLRTAVQNQLQALALGEGVCRRKKLWSKVGRKELQALALGPWTSRRREDWLRMLDRLHGWIEELDQAVRNEAESRPQRQGFRGTVRPKNVGPPLTLLPARRGDSCPWTLPTSL